MDVVTEVLEKVAGINWRTLAVPFVAFASSSQSFWQNDTSESWGDRGSKGDLFLDKHLGILSYSYSGCGFANERFPILVGGWIFSLFLYTRTSYFPFCLSRSCYDQELPRSQYNAILQRHVYMTISDLPHSYTHLSKLRH